jgi:methylthioribose-1-phosphate isomerase
MQVETLRWEGGRPGFVRLIEQTLLPAKHEVLDVKTVDAMVDAIKRLAVRGAPAIGVAAAYGMLLDIQHLSDKSPENVVGRAKEAAATLAKSRPTAVNLAWALKRMDARAVRDMQRGLSGERILDGLFEEAHAICAEDQATCRTLGDIGAQIIQDGWTILTHCNAGALAAINAIDGKQIWEFNTAQNFTTVNGVDARGGAISISGAVAVNGTLYVSSGYAISSGASGGNVLLAFSAE